MGASAWSWRVPYRQDLDAALQQARQEAYDQGKFYRSEPDGHARSMSEADYAAWDVAETRKSVISAFGDDGWEPDDAIAREEWRAAQIEVTDPDSLLRSQPFSGTHSIIDMTGVRVGAGEGGTCAGRGAGRSVRHVPAQRRRRRHSHRQPHTYCSERWHGKYVIAYDNDAPDAIFFFGYSGD